MRIGTSLGIATGILATAVSIPFILRDKSSLSPKGIDYDSINALRCDCADKRTQEIKWVEAVYPIVREKLINLYRAELEDIKALRAGKITEKDRAVKIYISDFVKIDEEADDMGIGPNIHVIKYFDEKQEDNSMMRTYVNEYWTVNERTGNILLPEHIRVRAQAFKGSLHGSKEVQQESKHNLFVTDMLQLIWTKDNVGIDPNSAYPYMARQHFYGERIPDKKENPINQTELMLSSPRHCIFCHVISGGNRHARHVFEEGRNKIVNYGALTQDYKFDKPRNEHAGYVKYMDFLNEKIKKGDIKQEYVDLIATDLMESTSLGNPFIIRALEKNDPIPWLDNDSDTKLKDSHSGILFKDTDPGREGFTYENGDVIWERAIYSYYKNRLSGLSPQWSKNDFQVIPRIR